MRKLKFKKARAENFLCFGPDGITVDFESRGNIVLILAKNLDVRDNDSSNGAGKSSIPEIPVYALFGKTIKKPKKLGNSDVINYKTTKKLVVEFLWDDYRVLRTRKPTGSATLQFWHSPEGKWTKETEKTLGDMRLTQKLIEETIGLNYETFVNVYVFSDDPNLAFLESDGPSKREIVENLLSLDKYRVFSENAKSYVRWAKERIKLHTKDYERALDDLDQSKNRMERIAQQEKDWKATKEKELHRLLETITRKRDELETSDTGTALALYTDAQDRIVRLQEEIPVQEEKRKKLQDVLAQAAPKLVKVNSDYKELLTDFTDKLKTITECNEEIAVNRKIIQGIKDKTGKDCPYCLGEVDESRFEHMLSKAESAINACLIKLTAANTAHDDLLPRKQQLEEAKKKLEKGISDCQVKLESISKALTEIHTSIAELSKIKEPEASVDERRIQEQIEELKQQVEAKKQEINGVSPFDAIRQSADAELIQKQTDLTAKKLELDTAEKELPYYEFWVKAFGDGGIRKYVIDGIIPALNSRIAYWLQFLIDNKIKLEFDNQLNEKIDRYPFQGRPYVYHGLSGGQRRRLNLTVSQAFAHIMMLNCGASPSVVFLDEVTMNMDTVGVEGIYRMICELAKDKQVFVIDHNENLLRLLDGCDTIRLEMKDEVTRMVS